MRSKKNIVGPSLLPQQGGRQIPVIGTVAQLIPHESKISNLGWFCKENVKGLKCKAFVAGSMKRFKTGEKVLTRLESLVYTGFSKGFRIIERLYPIHKGQNALKPLIYKGFLSVLPCYKK